MERIKHGNVLMTIENENEQEALELAKRFANIGYGIYATKGTVDLFEAEGLYVHRASKIETEDGKNVLDIIRNGRVNFIINTFPCFILSILFFHLQWFPLFVHLRSNH